MKKYSTPLAIKEGNTSQNIPEITSHPSQTGYYQNKIKQTIILTRFWEVEGRNPTMVEV
jgi:hypothetical protein